MISIRVKVRFPQLEGTFLERERARVCENLIRQGISETMEVPRGTTMAAWFASKMPGCSDDGWAIKVNGNRVGAQHQLQSGDVIYMEPLL